MTDEYIDEIHKIREKIYEEIKDMTSSEMNEYFHKSAERLEQRVAECRARKALKRQTEKSNTAR